MHQQAFLKLSEIFKNYLKQKEQENSVIHKSIEQAEKINPWFIKTFVDTMIAHITDLCDKTSIEKYISDFKITSSPKNVVVIAAGNIPMVSFHDVLTVLLSGHRLIFKPSSKDATLMKMILYLLQENDFHLKDKIFIQESIIDLKETYAVIATGTNNTAMHLNYYFSKYPRIIRNNRTSIGILDGTESQEELKKLADDIMLYFGLGCRNVSKIFIPENFDIQKIFAAVYDYAFVMQHHKYMNNYDYYRSIYLLNKEEFLDNHFLIIKESKSVCKASCGKDEISPLGGQLHAPVANLFYERYSNITEVEKYIEQEKNNIQTIVGRNYTPFGQSQFPDITDFADGINTKEFLMSL